MEEHARQKQEQLPNSGSPDLISRCTTCCFFFECNPQCASETHLEKLRHGPQDCCSSLENFLQIDLSKLLNPSAMSNRRKFRETGGGAGVSSVCSTSPTPSETPSRTHCGDSPCPTRSHLVHSVPRVDPGLHHGVGPGGAGKAQSVKASSIGLRLFLLRCCHAVPLKSPATKSILLRNQDSMEGDVRFLAVFFFLSQMRLIFRDNAVKV